MRSRYRRVISTIALNLGLVGLFQPTTAQQGATTGTIRGRVTTADNQPVPGAQVVVRNTATGMSRGVLSDAEGRYAVLLLPPGGPYTVRVTSIGHQDAERSGLFATAGDAVTVNFALGVQVVQIEGNAGDRAPSRKRPQGREAPEAVFIFRSSKAQSGTVPGADARR